MLSPSPLVGQFAASWGYLAGAIPRQNSKNLNDSFSGYFLTATLFPNPNGFRAQSPCTEAIHVQEEIFHTCRS
jgi:hypothetical protein